MLAVVVALSVLAVPPDEPIRLAPANPHYLEWRGRSTILLTSGEHYGAVLNLDFDHAPYLEELQARGFNLTRTFSGTYFEVPGAFRIEKNTLAPAPGRYQGPWAQVEGQEGKYDLDRFDPAYFARLKGFLRQAGERGIVVELVLFCPFYEENLWEVNPMNARNNVNGVGDCPRNEVYTLKHPELLKRQLAFVRQVVTELRDVGNLYYEICNEPYFGGVTLEWQAQVAEAIVATERDFAHKHLIAQNIANGKAKVDRPHPAVSIFNFHYATPPDTVGMNYGLNRPIGDDETGFKGTGDAIYRQEAWEFLLAGGAIFSHLDYSFTTDHENGTAPIRPPTPGGGGPTLRAQFAFLKQFIEGFDFLKMAPDNTVVVGGAPEKVTPRVLAEKGRQYAIYLSGGPQVTLELILPAATYEAVGYDPVTGRDLFRRPIVSDGGKVTIATPRFDEDLAIRLLAR